MAENDMPEGYEDVGQFEIVTGQFVIADPFFLVGLPDDVVNASKQLAERGRRLFHYETDYDKDVKVFGKRNRGGEILQILLHL